MGAFLFITGLVGLFLLVGLIFILVNNKTSNQVELNKAERRELLALRELRDGLLLKAVDRVDVEPFAVEIIDAIRTHQRSINPS